MDNQLVLQFVQQYGYWILYPLSIIEGPLVTLIGGGFAALGILRPELVFAISILGDLTMDLGLYYLGFFGNKKLRRFIERRPRLKRKHLQVQHFFENHGGKVIFLVKITVGLSYITFVTAGMIKMPLRRFLFFSFLGGIIWSGLLVSLGYFYGSLYKVISMHLHQAGIVVAIGALLTYIIIRHIPLLKSKLF